MRGGLPGVTLRSSLGYTVDVYTHGAHVTSWKDKDGTDMLFCSSEACRSAVFKPPKAIRGGIPICFPQFSDFGPLGQHGFARNATWEVRAIDRDVSPRPAETDKIILRLSDTPETLALWPHKFTVLYEVFADGKSLRTSMAVSNDGIEIDLENDENDPALPGGGGIRLGGRPMTFTAALHTYFSVTDITRATVTGLRNVEYLDSLRQRQKFTETTDVLHFPEEIDRIYLNTPNTLIVDDAVGAKTMSVMKSNLPDAVVWNPWVDKSAATGDLGDEEYTRFLCVEAAAIGTPVTLPPGETWDCFQILDVCKDPTP
ncbi:uncharacterized protein MICPUCDRAFT_18576 [Micromonas pusilla CCMP1545]|uniref:glucose-6-phosphate 1-epimerase n=1 Tax=Micromonas pusilla (strain CCMP1545) TaxID=564608 RepID=C1MWQ0_MICPC|nr:uncharacterized protein MICPUCDRAFT_18576 [Micromonas pusilla CCMP1545]EEH55617.1 predicted protein [Micromonas pusilla CCMP1545]|eukprot:XP_003059665.1 predicted protein [Micromonas pusilla CCMP1545]